jgi:hypothetical protein
MRARRLGIQPPPTHQPPTRQRWTPADDQLLTGHANLDPARLAILLGRSDAAVGGKLAALGLRQGRERSPHHPIAARPRLTPAQQRLLAREFRPGNGRVLVSLANRLGLPPGAVKQLAAALLPTTATAADPHLTPLVQGGRGLLAAPLAAVVVAALVRGVAHLGGHGGGRRLGGAAGAPETPPLSS